MPDNELLDVAEAANRHNCSTKSIWRRVWRGRLPAHAESVVGRDGRPVIKTLVLVSDLDQAIGLTAHDEHVQKICEATPPLIPERLAIIAQAFTGHRRDRGTVEAARQWTALIHVNPSLAPSGARDRCSSILDHGINVADVPVPHRLSERGW